MEIFLRSQVFRHSTVIGAQGGFEHAAREVACDNRLPICRSSTRRRRPSRTFLSTAMCSRKSCGCISAGGTTGSPARCKSRMARSRSAADPAELRGHLKRHHGSRRYRLTMQPDPITHMGLYGMTKGMPRLRVARTPDSRSSALTTLALAAQERWIASVSARESSERIRSILASSRSGRARRRSART